jgi:hypothetical protein
MLIPSAKNNQEANKAIAWKSGKIAIVPKEFCLLASHRVECLYYLGVSTEECNVSQHCAMPSLARDEPGVRAFQVCHPSG